MPRRRRAVVREVVPDPVYNSTLVEKFVKLPDVGGKKNTAQGISMTPWTSCGNAPATNPLKAFKKAVEKRQAACSK